jgi:YD repeat-containing protein
VNSRQLLTRVAAFLLLAGLQAAFGQHALNCDSSCGGSASTTTTSMVAARSAKQAVRQGGVARRVGGSTLIAGSRSYTYDVHLFSFPGRGFNLTLNLHYNSFVWTRVGNAINLNADRDTPSYGFRLDFGFMEFSSDQSSGVLTEANGVKHPLSVTGSQPSGILFQTTDATYIQVQYPTTGPLIATYKSGMRVFYQGFTASPTLEYRPYQIEDTNGNIIQIAYLNNNNLLLSTVTDTLGRTVHFYYDGTQTMLSCITTAANCSSPTTPTYTFSWNSAYVLNFNFTPSTGSSMQSGITTLNVLTKVVRPDGTQVTFGYGDWGIVNQIQELSTNGAVRYSVSYSFPPASAGALPFNPTFTRQTIFDGINTAVWTYQANTNSTNGLTTAIAVTAPTGATTTTSFSNSGDWEDGLPLEEQITTTGFQPQQACSPTPCPAPPPNNIVWRTVKWGWAVDAAGSNPHLTSITTILEDGITQSETVLNAYDANGNLTDLLEYDFGSGLHGPLLRETVATYAILGNNILDRLSDIKVKDINGNVLSHKKFNYDETTPAPVSPAPAGRDSSFSATARGNLTSSLAYTAAATDTGAIASTYTYNVLGNQLTSQVGCCTVTQNTFSLTTQYAYPDSVSVGPQGSAVVTQYTYNVDRGTLKSTTNLNGLTTNFTYDVDNRLLTTQTPDNITVSTRYDDNSAQASASTSTTGNSALLTKVFDGRGRTIDVEELNGSTLVSRRSFTYDGMGHLAQSSSPYGPNETPINTLYSYDILGRLLAKTPPASESGGAQDSYTLAYSGATVMSTDPSGHQRKVYRNAVGKLVRVDEPGVVAGHTNSAAFQTDGNLVVYGPANDALWSSNSAGSIGPLYVLGMQNNGDLVKYTPTWGSTASNGSGPYATPTGSVGCSTDALPGGQTLASGACIVSPSGRFVAYMQTAGNLVVYDRSYSPWLALWANSGTGTSGSYLAMQGDGNLVIYTSLGSPVWSTNTVTSPGGNGTYVLKLQDQGNLVIYKDLWETGTTQPSTQSTAWATLSCSNVGQNTSLGAALVGGSTLTSGQCVLSANGRFGLVMQTDGNLVIADRSTTPPQTIWYSGTALTPMTPGVALSTSYAYDGMGRLTQVSQGDQRRSYSYDSLGRVISSSIPETRNQAVTISYTDFGAISQIVDPRVLPGTNMHVTTSVSYDPLNRLKSITYNDNSTPGITYTYNPPMAAANTGGRLANVTTTSTDPNKVISESYEYDVMGRPTKSIKTILGNQYPITYSYHSDGVLASIMYPSGRVISTDEDAIGRLLQIGVNGSTIFSTGAQYDAAGQLLAATFGQGAVAFSASYNGRLQLSRLTYTNSTGPILDLSYDYGGAANNGQIIGITDSVVPARSTSYTYDDLGRLAFAQTNDLVSANTWKLGYTYESVRQSVNGDPPRRHR